MSGIAGNANGSHGNICEYYIGARYKGTLYGRKKDANVKKFAPICKKFGKETFASWV
jgi:hypothetical protein